MAKTLPEAASEMRSICDNNMAALVSVVRLGWREAHGMLNSVNEHADAKFDDLKNGKFDGDCTNDVTSAMRLLAFKCGLEEAMTRILEERADNEGGEA